MDEGTTVPRRRMVTRLVDVPTAAAIAAVPVLLFAPTLAQYRGLGWAQHADEVAVAVLAVAFGARCVALRRRPRLLPGLLWIGAYLVAGAVSGLLTGAPLWLMTASALLSLKGWILALVLAQADWTRANLRRLGFVVAGCAAFTVAVSAANLVAPAWVTHLAGAGAPVFYRWALPSLIGPFITPIAYGDVMSVAAGALAALAVCGPGRLRRPAAWGALAAAVCAVLSARRLALLAVVAAVVVLLVVYRAEVLARTRRFVPGWRRGEPPTWRVAGPWAAVTALGAAVVAAAVLGGLRLWHSVAADFLGSGPESARTLLTRGSFTVAGEHFPLGAGLGRYGSYLAGRFYSPEYGPLGFQRVWGLRSTPGNNAFLTDTFWPAILGEAGWIGLAAYVVAVVLVFRRALLLFRRGSGPARVVGLMTVLAWVPALVLSAGGAVFSAVPLLVIPFVLLGVLGSFGTPPRAEPARRTDPEPAEELRTP